MPEQKRKRWDAPPLPPNSTLITRIGEQIRLAWALFGDNRVALWMKVLPVLAIAYAISPLDLMPAILFRIFGVIDDIALLALAVILFNSLAPGEVVVEYLKKFRTTPIYKVHRDKEGIVVEMKATPSDEQVADAAENLSEETVADEDAAETQTKRHQASSTR